MSEKMTDVEICELIVKAQGDCRGISTDLCFSTCPLHSGAYNCDTPMGEISSDERNLEQAKRYLADHGEKTKTELYCELYAVEVPEGWEVIDYRNAEDGDYWLGQWGGVNRANAIRTSIPFPILKKKEPECDHRFTVGRLGDDDELIGIECMRCGATCELGEWKKEGDK